jgi:hypothetical protein
MGGQCHNLDRTKTINVEDFWRVLSEAA